MELNRNLRDALLFSILSYMTNALLGAGNYVGALDELYLFLTNLTAIEYIRNLMKRDRKKDSLLVLSSQNIGDFLQPGVKELTKPLFSIPTHQFLFNPGQLEPKTFCDTLQLEQADQCHGLDASIFSDPPNIGSNPDVLLDLLLLHRRLRNRTCFGPILLYSMEER